jgi:para-aminobenzoate synthetase component 1
MTALSGSPSPEAVFASIAARPGAAWLDGGAGAEGWSILTWGPEEVLVDPRDGPRAGRALTAPRSAAPGLPFAGGALGYLGYGAGAEVEAVPREAPTDEPPVWLGRYPGGLCFHHPTRAWHVGGTPAFRDEARALLAAAAPLSPPPPPTPTTARTLSPARHAAAVRRALEWIAAGDCYQVNLTRAVHVRGAGDPWAAYRRLRAASDARFGAFLRLDPRLAVLSNSPELLVRVEDGLALSEPIKGTRPRAADPAADAALLAELEASDKERAELTMIVDLLRNDLGRVARAGGVRAGARRLASHARVHHASQPVRAELRPGVDAWGVLAALLPFGSITGAPKVRACQRIAALEEGPRGVYCGALGYVADGGAARWSVAIRAAVFRDGDARYHVGGGIVADSEPAAEWAETEAKGAALAEALGIGAAARPVDLART